MPTIGRTLGAIALSAAMLGTSPAYAAPATQSVPDATIQCSTWQYVTDTGMPIYYGAGTATGQKSTTRSKGFVNVTGFSGNWRGGNFYTDPGPVWYTSGWIHLTHIHYAGCW